MNAHRDGAGRDAVRRRPGPTLVRPSTTVNDRDGPEGSSGRSTRPLPADVNVRREAPGSREVKRSHSRAATPGSGWRSVPPSPGSTSTGCHCRSPRRPGTCPSAARSSTSRRRSRLEAPHRADGPRRPAPARRPVAADRPRGPRRPPPAARRRAALTGRRGPAPPAATGGRRWAGGPGRRRRWASCAGTGPGTPRPAGRQGRRGRRRACCPGRRCSPGPTARGP